jgi:3-hydroxyisobutyrate dehydrogenase-like beta-hydroxyacid dehydrogenase
MKEVRIAIIGLGNMGGAHAKYLGTGGFCPASA